jgi:hypothetical protein
MRGKRKHRLSDEEIDQILKTCEFYEAKLIELMGEDAFFKFSTQIAKELFADSIMGMADSDFKNFCLDNFDAITGGNTSDGLPDDDEEDDDNE